MLRPKLKPKRLNLKQNAPLTDDPYYNAMVQIKGEKTEEKALETLLTIHEQNAKDIPTDVWLSFKEHLPPHTNQMIVIYDSRFIKTKELYVSYVYLQHYLIAKYLHGLKDNFLFQNVEYFMLLSEPDD